jgi:hypothetical protein
LFRSRRTLHLRPFSDSGELKKSKCPAQWAAQGRNLTQSATQVELLKAPAGQQQRILLVTR